MGGGGGGGGESVVNKSIQHSKQNSVKKLIFLFHNQYMCCGYSIEPSQRDRSFEPPKHINLMSKKIFTILCSIFLF